MVNRHIPHASKPGLPLASVMVIVNLKCALSTFLHVSPRLSLSSELTKDAAPKTWHNCRAALGFSVSLCLPQHPIYVLKAKPLDFLQLKTKLPTDEGGTVQLCGKNCMDSQAGKTCWTEWTWIKGLMRLIWSNCWHTTSNLVSSILQLKCKLGWLWPNNEAHQRDKGSIPNGQVIRSLAHVSKKMSMQKSKDQPNTSNPLVIV